MKKTRLLMGMPITVEVTDRAIREEEIDKVFFYFEYVDETFSTYKDTSEISRLNRGEVFAGEYSDDMKTVLALCEETKKLTSGYFDIRNREGKLDPSGLVKGWAIHKASQLLKDCGWKNYYVDAGGDIQSAGTNNKNQEWSIGIQNPFNLQEIVKVIYPRGKGVATSGTYIRGQHIYNPSSKERMIDEVVSLTVIGPNIYEADRFATAAFAMGREGINFIENLPGFEGYQIDAQGQATFTSGFNQFTREHAHVD